MKKPVILAVDDEPVVLAAVSRDLRREYGDRYRILRASSGESALEAVRELKVRGEALALLVVDQRMPELSGVEVIEAAIEVYPDARRVLLTAYSDTEAAIAAINRVRLDHYLLKPWDPPEERLYPVLDDLLDQWWATHPPDFEGVRVIGHRWSSEGHRIRDYLARNLIPYRWLDAEADAEGERLVAAAGLEPASLPLVIFPDGSKLMRPSTSDLASGLGFPAHAASAVYDLVIVGGGPAGLAAAVYGASEGLSTLLIEEEAPGGQAGLSSRIENYLGFPVGLSGNDLARRAVSQARRFGTEILTPARVTALSLESDYRILHLTDGARVAAQTVLISTGVSYRMLDAPGAERLHGAGVFYGAAITEAQAVRGKDVLVIGGGNSAGQAAIYLAGFANSVKILIRGASLDSSMSRYLIAQIEETPRIGVEARTEVMSVEGERWMERAIVHRREGVETIDASAMFVFIGAVPHTDWLGDVVRRDARGFVLTGPAVLENGHRPAGWTAARDPFWLETNVAGVFAAGDVRQRSIKRIASAVGEGAMAVQFIHQHLGGAVLAPHAGAAPAAREAAESTGEAPTGTPPAEGLVDG